MLEAILQTLGRALLVIVATWLDEREAERHRVRNAAGQCAFCGCAPGAAGMRQVRHSNKATVQQLDVCGACLVRRRRHRILAWTILLSVVVAALWWSIAHR